MCSVSQVSLRLPRVSINPNVHFLAFSVLSLFFLSLPLLRWTKGGIHFPSKLWWVSQAMCSQPFFFLPEITVQLNLQAVLSLDNLEGERERQLLCSKACSCTGLVVTEFTVSTGCQANWDFTMDKALGSPFSGTFCNVCFCTLFDRWHLPTSTLRHNEKASVPYDYCVQWGPWQTFILL